MKRVIRLITIAIMTIMMLTGCRTKETTDQFREFSIQCVEDNEGMLLELYDNIISNDITRIIQIEAAQNVNQEDIDNKEDNGFYIENNEKYFFISVTDEEQVDCSSEAYLRVCEIVDALINKYSVKYVYYYHEYMAIQFDENYLGADYSIKYYPPDVDPSGEYLEQHSEEIQDRFYFNILYIGF